MSNPKIIKYSEIVEENGKTIRENNMEVAHKLPIGAKVWSTYLNQQGVVVSHDRDCDGTPLYTVQINQKGLSEENLMLLVDFLRGLK